jgi:hypothetical protein
MRVISRRFPIWERHGSSARKCRNIDEMSESGINSTVEDFETYVPKGIEHILALLVLLQHIFGHDFEFHGWTADFKHAYRQMGAKPSEYPDLGIAWWDCNLQQVMVGILTALAFGSRRAPANWGRVVLFLMTISWHHFCILALDYVDDVTSIEPVFSAESGRDCFHFLVSLCGLHLDPVKSSSKADSQFDSLGVRWVLNDPAGVVEILRRRADSLIAEINDIIANNILYPGQAARLRGKLSFAAVAAFGRFGRAQLAPIKRRQYRHYASAVADFSLTPQLLSTLRWWIMRLQSLPPRAIPRSPSSKVLVAYSDGEGSGQVAVCLTFADRTTEFCCTAVPGWLLQRWSGEQHIQRIEGCGPAVCLLTWKRQLQGQLLLFFIDNTSALGSLIGGWSNEQVLNDLTALTWALAADLHVFVYFEWVESAANVIDKASRAKCQADLQVYQQRNWRQVTAVQPWQLLPP